MKTGITTMGHHNPKHIQTDITAMAGLQVDDLFLAAQENDFIYFPGKLRFTPQIAEDHGIRPLAIIWGALNLFGGGRSSQFLLENPTGFQVDRQGRQRSQGCYINPICREHIQTLIDTIVEHGFRGYLIDEPTPLRECFCQSCQRQFEDWYGSSLLEADPEPLETFRQRCVIDYIAGIAAYCQTNHPDLETICCLMPVDQALWAAAGEIAALDNLGTDIYWTNNNRDLEEMRPLIREMAAICRAQGKVHHEWLECWRAKRGNEPRIFQQGEIIVQEQPDALYIWAWEGQIGTAESCEDPVAAWAEACKVLWLAKQT